MTTSAPAIARPRPSWATPPAADHAVSGPRVLVAFASRHGATREVAAELVRALPRSASGRNARLSAVLVPVQRRPDPTEFDALVLGSALYDGGWLEPALRYAEGIAHTLEGRPTWLFSSGLGADRSGIPTSLDARGHRTFPGHVEPRLLSPAERAAWPAASAVGGDVRNRPAVAAWAEEIAAALPVRRLAAAAG